MKSFTFPLVLIFALAWSGLEAQNPARPNSIMAKKLWIDHHTPKDGTFSEFSNYSDGFEIAYLRNLNRFLNGVIPVKMGVIDLPEEVNNRTIVSLDGLVQFQYFKEENPVIPYGLGGIGMVMSEFEDIDFQLPLGLGLHFKLGRFGYINVQSEYRISLTMDQSNLQHGIGIGFMLGKYTDEDLNPLNSLTALDSDKDGVLDDEDLCPNEPGKPAFNGCPDTDGDGIQDAEDNCPEDFGTQKAKGCPDTDDDGVPNDIDDCPDVVGSLNGCPDSDGDGLADKDDRCPNEAGDLGNEGCPTVDSDGDGFADNMDDCPDTAGTLKGCPDSDGDGIADAKDNCPFAKGEGRFNGCPDSDGDGIDDSRDRCPNMAAPESANGCPSIEKEDREVLDYAIQAVQFEFGSSVLLQASYAVLDQVLDVLQKYPDYKLSIIGHTDDVGPFERNQQLSVKRAKACADYLISKGISVTRISYGGFGETRPIAGNDTEEGKAL
ncbi:MAG: OmpA family protein, partial [Bacteroidota bacterium]